MSLRSRADDANNTTIPLPVEVEVSEVWDGIDGKWSTFKINLGDRDGVGLGQNFRVLPSTFSGVTTVPGPSDDCKDDCAKQRGVELYSSKQPHGFSRDLTLGWNFKGIYRVTFPDWWSDGGTNGSLYLGNVGLGVSSKESPILKSQWVEEVPSKELFMGSFGLAVGSVSPGSDGSSTFLQTFNDNKVIPSLSYGYTAGASYRNIGGVFGSLVLGGYDESRINATSPNVTIRMPDTVKNNTLVVGVQSIVYITDPNTSSSKFSLNVNSPLFYATIDSTLPFWYLPDEICEQFGDKFQLQYDADKNLYTVNASAHNWNIRQNPTVQIQLGQTNGNTVNSASFSLPYGAFDLEGSAPLFNETTRYFPLRKSPKRIYVLGRSFLQETYITVDYERKHFTVSQAAFSDPMPARHIVPILSKDVVPPAQSSSAAGGGGSGLSGGAIAGIVVGILVALGLLALGAFIFWKRKHRQQREASEKVSDFDPTSAGDQFRPHYELDSERGSSPNPSMGGFYGDKVIKPFPPVVEMESPPAELDSPPARSLNGLSGATPMSERDDYFIAGTNLMRRRGATRESTGNNTPGTPAYELPADNQSPVSPMMQAAYPVETMGSPVVSPIISPAVLHNRGPSHTSLATNIDQVIANSSTEAGREDGVEKNVHGHGTEQLPSLERRTSHARGPSDTTVQSESTAISQPTPEELQHWNMTKDDPKRPLSE